MKDVQLTNGMKFLGSVRKNVTAKNDAFKMIHFIIFCYCICHFYFVYYSGYISKVTNRKLK